MQTRAQSPNDIKTHWKYTPLYQAYIGQFHPGTKEPSHHLAKEPDAPTPLQAQEIIKACAKRAINAYLDEPRIPLKTSSLGIRHGFFSFIRHHDTHENLKPIFEPVLNATSEKTALREAAALLKMLGSLWDEKKGKNHSIGNYFLSILRKESIYLYKRVVERRYGIHFISNHAQTLYRRDTRPHDLIFHQGFQLKENEHNHPETRKNTYSQLITEDYGVSFSPKHPPSSYGNPNEMYVIELPENHDLLFIDVIHCKENQRAIALEDFLQHEWNACDDLPQHFIKGLLITHPQTKFIPNPHFDPTQKAPLKPRGCY